MKSETTSYRFITLVLRFGLIVALFAAGWFVYVKLPHRASNGAGRTSAGTNLRIVLLTAARRNALDIPLELYPIDIVAVRHEYFAERRAGKRFEDFLKERMNGRTPMTTRLDNQGQATIVVTPGNWWVHALLYGEEDLEWRLPVSVAGQKQTVELTPQNAYTRAKSF